MPNIHNIISILEEIYPEAICSLEYDGDPWKLLIAARLSAQCTDERVNIVCGPLFRRFPNAESMAAAEQSEVEELIRSCGLYRTKAQSCIEMSRQVVEDFSGRVPDTMEELLSLSGVGRKIANLILGDIYHKPGIVADTHCIRINGRFGFYDESLKDPFKVERILSGIVPPEKQSDYCHRMVLFGREYCMARGPRCDECPLRGECGRVMSDE
ncbi:MAG: endonuclease III [Ruminococcaceae bacterium]|nr:endonuclease III [Oscillospiraceae bacterium]